MKTVPLTWMFSDHGSRFVEMLPSTTAKYVKSQHRQFLCDYSKVVEFIHLYKTKLKITRSEFLWAWLACNTRCLYMELPNFLHCNVKENFTLVPYVDFLNHTLEDHCTISINSQCFSVTTAKSHYGKSEQLFFSYGAHSDKILLCDYGFMLPYGQNRWNDLDISSIILKLLKPHQKLFLQNENYYGDYTITKDSLSFRTEIALATLQEKDNTFIQLGLSKQFKCPERLRKLIDGYSDGNYYKNRSEQLMEKIRRKIKDYYQKQLMVAKQMDSSITTDKVIKSRLNTIKACYLNILLILS
ncbi:hypothetical protein FOA43_002393 [Brettanomyces nanus]|uniref:SET domain-containing protein n=1 Tax=Eeniella nana TaxID=13502 RepID=A0A875S2B0_EENNA|nr:uncharacterized protein FOA43_002393 [Brettanomyces nanus]QPG75053.1 hypothetical protein FOA43_002393 [Brettanomyces nanus]